MKEITLTQGKVAIVDDVYFDTLNSSKWCFHDGHGKRRVGKRFITIERQLLTDLGRLEKEKKIYHKDKNLLNDQLDNLILATKDEISRSRGIGRNNKTGFKGVSFRKYNNRYQASIRVDRRLIVLGTYETSIEAALAYNVAAARYFGEFAFLNIFEE